MSEPSTSINQDRRELVERLNATARNSAGNSHGRSGRRRLMEPRGRHARTSRMPSWNGTGVLSLSLPIVMLSSLCVPTIAMGAEHAGIDQHDSSHTVISSDATGQTDTTADDSHDDTPNVEMGGTISDGSPEGPLPDDDAMSAGSLMDNDSSSSAVDSVSANGNDVIASGTWGTCTWSITGRGVLTFSGGTGVQSVKFTDNIHGLIKTDDRPWRGYTDRVTAIRTTGVVILPYSAGALFYGMTNLTDISGLTKFDTKGTAVFTAMFQRCSKLSDLTPLANWDMGNAIDFIRMFNQCTSLTNLNGLEKWNVEQLRNTSFLFMDCLRLSDISQLSEWKPIRLFAFQQTFNNCRSLESLHGLEKWKTSSFGDIDNTFLNCVNLKDITALSSWDTSNVNMTYGLFRNCTSLVDFTPIRDWDMSNVVSARAMFEGCTGLRTLEPFSKWTVTSKMKDARWMFEGCIKLEDTSVIGGWDMSGLMDDTGITDGSGTSASHEMFLNTPSLVTVGIPEPNKGGQVIAGAYTPPVGMRWTPKNENGGTLPASVTRISQKKVVAGMDVSSPSDVSGYRVWSIAWQYWGTCPWWFDDETGVLHINGGTGADVTVSNPSNPNDETTKLIPWWSVSQLVRKIETEGTVIMPASSQCLFMYTRNLSDLSGLRNWDASHVTDMSNMFRAGQVFKDWTSIRNLDALSGWDVSNVQDMNCMFWGQRLLENVNGLADWDTSSLTNTSWMFQGNVKLASLEPLVKWKMGNVTSMLCMFEGCISLESLDGLQEWDVSNVVSMNGMFSSSAYPASDNPTSYGTSKLTDINALSKWATSKNKMFIAMFAGSMITNLDPLKDWDVSSGSHFMAMFRNCVRLEDTAGISNWRMDAMESYGDSTVLKYLFDGSPNIIRAGVPAVNHGARYVAPEYPNRNWTDEGLPITPLKNSNGIYPYMTSNTEGREFTNNGGVFIQYRPVYFVNYDSNGVNPDDKAPLPERQWAYVNDGTVTLPDYDGIKTGYDFKGWSDGDGKVLKPGESYRPSSPTDQVTTTLTAVWESVHHHEVPETGSHGLFWLFTMIGVSIMSILGVKGAGRKPADS